MRCRSAPPSSTAHRPSAAHHVSVSAGPVAAAPSKKDTERSSEAPAPGGSHWPIAPAGWGSISGAEDAPEKGCPAASSPAPPSPRPARPRSAPSPAMPAPTARARQPEHAGHGPPVTGDHPEPAVRDRRRDQAGQRGGADQGGGRAGAAQPQQGSHRARRDPGQRQGQHARAQGPRRAGPSRSGHHIDDLDRAPAADACPATACCSSWATAGLAADAVSSFGPRSPAITAPYTVRSSMAPRAASSSA